MHHPRYQYPVASWKWALALVVLAALALWVGWVGFIASDDSLYYVGAHRWLVAPPFAGDTHWSTRFPLILLFAGVIALVGENYAAFGVTAMLCYALLVALTWRYATRVGGARAGWIAAILTATMPVIVSNATSVSVDLIEASAILAGALLLADARDDRAGLWRGVAAGVAVRQSCAARRRCCRWSGWCRSSCSDDRCRAAC